MIRNRKVFIALFFLTILVFQPRTLYDCGPFLPQTLFIDPAGPDFPRENFHRGQLGILQSTFWSQDLVIAYRYLEGVGLNSTEVRSFFPRPLPASAIEKTPLNIWYATRKKVVRTGPNPVINQYQEIRQTSPRFYFSQYLNCTDDAFLVAAKTLDERLTRFGTGAPAIKEWVQAQDRVFSNCSGPQNIPSPANPELGHLSMVDRAYQIAAANFYAGNYDTAQKEFEEIAKDASSPWSRIAPYLVARTLIRKATAKSSVGSTDTATLALAEARLEAITHDPRLASIHPAAERLLPYVRARLNPEQQLVNLSNSISKKHLGKELSQEVHDYWYLLSRLRRKAGIQTAASYPTQDLVFSELEKVRAQSDLTDWVLTFQATSAQATDHALQKWESTRSLPWLVASIGKINSTNPKKSQLIRAADKFNPRSPAFESLAYYSLQLLLEAGERRQALERLNILLGQKRATLTVSMRNMLFAARMSFAGNLNEFLTYAQREPTASSYWGFNDLTGEVDNRRSLFDADSTQVLNTEMPLTLLADAARSEILPLQLRRELAIGTWVRSILLGDDRVSAAMTPVLEDLAPEMKDSLEAYKSAPAETAKKFAAAFLLLKFPGMRPFFTPGVLRKGASDQIDDFRDNWWCSLNPSLSNQWGYFATFPNYYTMKTNMAEPLMSFYRHAHLNAANFLKEKDKALGQRQWKTLASMPTAPNYLSGIAIGWARSHRDDPRVPEALYLAVRSTRLGCVDDDTSRLSRQAFELLHRRYPQSEWAKKTPYWFK